MNYKNIFKKFGDFLLARSLSGGLEINDTSIRFVSTEGTTLATASVALPPGALIEGRVEDRVAFVQALQALRAQILGPKARRRAPINAVVSLSSVNVYTQVFNLPFIEGENLEKAIQLNIQMASPSGTAGSYAGWQTVRSQDEHDMHLEVVTAFLPRGVADDLTVTLRLGGFLPIALESRALSFARLIKEKGSGTDPNASLIAISADASGLDVMVVRAGHLHFDYFNSWKDLQGGERQITLEMFRTLVVRSVNQVMNFYSAHWKDPVAEMLVASTGMKDEILTAIRDNFGVKVSELVPLVSPPVTPEWFVALGGALRSMLPRRQDTEISLLGISAQDEFEQEQVRTFLDFWRVLVPAVLGVVFVAFVGGWFFLNTFQSSLDPQARAATAVPPPAELGQLEKQAAQFNSAVQMIDWINGNAQPKNKILGSILEITTGRGITITDLAIGAPSALVSLQGTGDSSDDILALKDELAITPGFTNVNLPLTAIQQQTTGTGFSFSLTFNATP